MDKLFLKKKSKANGTINLPGSKSLSNRILLLSALAKGTTHIHNLLDSDDTYYMLTALKHLNIKYELKDNNECIVHGNNGLFEINENLNLFLGNAGTAYRPLVAVLAFNKGKGTISLDGEPRMHERPIGHLVSSLLELGANIDYLKNKNYPPLAIQGIQQVATDTISVDGSISSQFLTALLMIAPLIGKELNILIKGDLVSKPYIDITLHTMQQFGVKVINNYYKHFIIKPQQYVSPQKIMVEGDASSASYFLASGAIAGEVTVTGIGFNSVQGDVLFADVLEQMGATVIKTENSITVKRNKFPLQAIDVDLNHIPDAAMTIASTALFADGTTTIRNIYNWRVKETDRLSAMATELRKVGATVVEGNDYIQITPPTEFKLADIATYNDHRIAMCFSLVSFKHNVNILDPKCVNKTFPDFFKLFAQI